MRVLAVDDEPPALDELAYLLRADPRVDQVLLAPDGLHALQLLEGTHVDALFLDIHLPGLDGLQLARVLSRFAAPPRIVFVTAYDDAAIEAFALRATDYLLKPLRQARLAEAVARLVEAAPPPEPDEVVSVELGGITRFVAVADVLYVEACGDYVRLHTAAGSHLLRTAMTVLEERWSALGFVRVHRSYLVAAGHIQELRLEPGSGQVVGIGGVCLPVSRRHSRELKDRLLHRPRREG